MAVDRRRRRCLLRRVLLGAVGDRLTCRGNILAGAGGRLAGTEQRHCGDQDEQGEGDGEICAHGHGGEPSVCVKSGVAPAQPTLRLDWPCCGLIGRFGLVSLMKLPHRSRLPQGRQ